MGSALKRGHGGGRRGHIPDGRAEGEALERVQLLIGREKVKGEAPLLDEWVLRVVGLEAIVEVGVLNEERGPVRGMVPPLVGGGDELAVVAEVPALW